MTETTLERTMDLEHRLLPVMVRMSLAGVPVDYEAWKQAAEECAESLKPIEEKLHRIAPEKPGADPEWNLDSPRRVKELLSHLRIDVPDTAAKTLEGVRSEHPAVPHILDYRRAKKAKDEQRMKRHREEISSQVPPPQNPPNSWNFGSPAQVQQIAELLGFELAGTAELELKTHKEKHAFFELMLEYRRISKLVSTYGVSWFKDAYHDGRVYPLWRQLGTATGRMSCSRPNLQQLPNAGPYRACVRAPEGRKFIIADYSQIELRIAAKIAGDEGMLEAFKRGDDIHTETATILTRKAADAVTRKDRSKAKAVNFGLLYGMSPRSLPNYALKNYGVPMTSTEASTFYNRYFEARPGLKSWQRAESREFFDNGKCMDQYTLIGRRRKDIDRLTDALNHPVQGTGADGLKLALCLLHERREEFPTAVPIIAAHDEIVYECDAGEAHAVGEWVKATMVEAMDEVVNRTEPKVPIEVEMVVKKEWSK